MTLAPNILVVDDEPRMNRSLVELLHERGYDISGALSGKEAVGILKQKDFDVVLLDLVMPDMNGHLILERIKKDTPGTLIIIMTGHASVDSAVKCLKMGAYDYLKKPFEHEELIARVENALNQKRLEKEKELISKRLELSDASYQYLVQNSPDIIYTLDSEGFFNFINGPVKEILGYGSHELIGRHYRDIVHPDDVEKAKFAFNERRTSNRISNYTELRLITKPNGVAGLAEKSRYTIVELRAKGIYSRENNRLVYVGTYGVARDITSRKESEQTIRTNLQEKEVLLREVHHRVKNNMQIIISLMKLQERRVKHSEAKEACRESHNRIMAMSLIHEMLYLSENLARINFRTYISRLVATLFSAYGIDDRKVNFKLEMDRIVMGINQAIPCGLVLNELISNSLKHAFPEEAGGDIILKGMQSEGGEIKLVVTDNGAGIPDDLDIRSSDSLGLKLVEGLVKDQLKGSMITSHNPGTQYTIWFMKKEQRIQSAYTHMAEEPFPLESDLYEEQEEFLS